MPSRHLFIIRIALVSGVAAFAALVVVQRSRGTLPDLSGDASMLAMMRYTLWALAALAGLGALFIRSRLESAKDAQRGQMTVIGWALGEGVALFGVVQHYLGAPVTTMVVGLVAFVLALVLLPVPRDRA